MKYWRNFSDIFTYTFLLFITHPLLWGIGVLVAGMAMLPPPSGRTINLLALFSHWSLTAVSLCALIWVTAAYMRGENPTFLTVVRHAARFWGQYLNQYLLSLGISILTAPLIIFFATHLWRIELWTKPVLWPQMPNHTLFINLMLSIPASIMGIYPILDILVVALFAFLLRATLVQRPPPSPSLVQALARHSQLLLRFWGYGAAYGLLIGLLAHGFALLARLFTPVALPVTWSELLQGELAARGWLRQLWVGDAYSIWFGQSMTPLNEMFLTVLYIQLTQRVSPTDEQVTWRPRLRMHGVAWGALLLVISTIMFLFPQLRSWRQPGEAIYRQTVLDVARKQQPIYQVQEMGIGKIQFVGPGATLFVKDFEERLLALDGWLTPRLGWAMQPLRPNARAEVWLNSPRTVYGERWSELVALTQDGQLLVKLVTLPAQQGQQTEQHELEIWATARQALLYTIAIKDRVVRSFALAANGQRIALFYDQGVDLYTQQGKTWSATRLALARRPDAFALSPAGNLLATGSITEPIKLWDANNGRLQPITFTGYITETRIFTTVSIAWSEPPPMAQVLHNALEQIAFSPDGRWLAATSQRTLYLWRTADGALLFKKPLQANPAPKTGQLPLTFSADSRLLATGVGKQVGLWRFAEGDWGTVELIDVHSGKIVRKLETLTLSAAFSPNGQYFATSGKGVLGSISFCSLQIFDIHDLTNLP